MSKMKTEEDIAEALSYDSWIEAYEEEQLEEIKNDRSRKNK